jgi:hypothetical protein
MATRRNYKNKVPTFNFIKDAYTYEKIERDIFQWEKSKTGKIKVNQIINPKMLKDIPRNIKWEIEEDINKGAKSLAKYFNNTVIVKIEKIYEEKQPKMAIDLNIHPGGYYETIQYYRASTPNKVFHPDKTETKIKIFLTINPSNKHYIHKAERRKKVSHNYCSHCMLSTNTVATKGSGFKSSWKTKGREKLKKLRYYGSDFY